MSLGKITDTASSSSSSRSTSPLLLSPKDPNLVYTTACITSPPPQVCTWEPDDCRSNSDFILCFYVILLYILQIILLPKQMTEPSSFLALLLLIVSWLKSLSLKTSDQARVKEKSHKRLIYCYWKKMNHLRSLCFWCWSKPLCLPLFPQRLHDSVDMCCQRDRTRLGHQGRS